MDPSQSTTIFATAPVPQRLNATFDVFSATGKYLGRVDRGATAAESLTAALKQAGYANGVYIIRAAGRTHRLRVQ